MHLSENGGVQMLGQIKHGSCRPRAILFKVLADAVGIESRLVVVRFTFMENVLFYYSFYVGVSYYCTFDWEL